MDFWDTSNLVKLGTCRAYCSSSHVWSPDGRYLMASVLWPRMRVDNGIKIFNIFGQLVWSSGTELKELWQATWQPHLVHRESPPPQSASPARAASGHQLQLYTYPKPQSPITLNDIYPDVDFGKILVNSPSHEAGVGSASNSPALGATRPGEPKGGVVSGLTSANPKAPAKGGAYKHPHWSGRSSTGMVRSNLFIILLYQVLMDLFRAINKPMRGHKRLPDKPAALLEANQSQNPQRMCQLDLHRPPLLQMRKVRLLRRIRRKGIERREISKTAKEAEMMETTKSLREMLQSRRSELL